MTGSVARRGKPYVEAFPALSHKAARRAWNKGERFIEWTNEEGVVMGHVELLAMSDTHICFRHQLFGTANVEKSSDSNELAVCSRRVNPMHVAHEVVCPVGQCRVDNIYLVRGKWACRKCHGLVHLVQRLSLLHKLVLQRDALKASLDNAPSEQRRTRDYHNGRRKLERLSREATDLTKLPQELSFRAAGRWLADGETPKRAVEAGEEGYGWVLGEQRGFRAFSAPEPPPLRSVQKPGLTRLPRDLPLVGLKLFRGDLMRMLAELLEGAFAAAVQAASGELLTSEELATLISSAAAIHRLEVDTESAEIRDRFDEEGQLRIYATLRYSGDIGLLRVKAPTTSVSPGLRANFNEDSITLSTFPCPEHWDRAEQVIRLGVRLLGEQVAAQEEVLARFHGYLPENADQLAAEVLSRRERGDSSSFIKIDFAA